MTEKKQVSIRLSPEDYKVFEVDLKSSGLKMTDFVTSCFETRYRSLYDDIRNAPRVETFPGSKEMKALLTTSHYVVKPAAHAVSNARPRVHRYKHAGKRAYETWPAVNTRLSPMELSVLKDVAGYFNENYSDFLSNAVEFRHEIGDALTHYRTTAAELRRALADVTIISFTTYRDESGLTEGEN